MAQQTIQLTNAPNQTVTVSLSVDGQPLTRTLFVHYNEVANYWSVSVFDVNNNLLVVFPMLTGNDPACNMLRQFSFLEIGSAYVINESGSLSPNYPNNTNLGTGFQLIWGDTP